MKSESFFKIIDILVLIFFLIVSLVVFNISFSFGYNATSQNAPDETETEIKSGWQHIT